MLMNIPLLEGPNAILFLQSLFLLSSKHPGAATESAIHTVGASLWFIRMWNALKLTLLISFRWYCTSIPFFCRLQDSHCCLPPLPGLLRVCPLDGESTELQAETSNLVPDRGLMVSG